MHLIALVKPKCHEMTKYSDKYNPVANSERCETVDPI